MLMVIVIVDVAESEGAFKVKEVVEHRVGMVEVDVLQKLVMSSLLLLMCFQLNRRPWHIAKASKPKLPAD